MRWPSTWSTFIRYESLTVMPGILTQRTLSTLKVVGSLGRICMHARATRGASTPSSPYCLAAMALRRAAVTSASFLKSSTCGLRAQGLALSPACHADLDPKGVEDGAKGRVGREGVRPCGQIMCRNA